MTREEALKKLEKELDEIIEAAPAGLLFVDFYGQVIQIEITRIRTFEVYAQVGHS